MMELKGLLDHMRKNGLKVTEQRKLIAKEILAKSDIICAGELAERVRMKQSDISVDTVYRTLASLCATGMLYRVQKNGRSSEYEIIAGKHLHYIICSECGQREKFEDCAFEHDGLSQKQRKGFLLTGHKLELYGICPSCLQKEN